MGMGLGLGFFGVRDRGDGFGDFEWRRNLLVGFLLGFYIS